MCVEFYLITKKAGAKISLLWKLIAASVFMLVTGYIGEAIYPAEKQSWIWGFVSSIGYFYIVYIIWFGDVASLAKNSGPAVTKAVKTLAWFVLVGWATYPIGYIAGTEGGLFGVKVFGMLKGFSTFTHILSSLLQPKAEVTRSLYIISFTPVATGFFLVLLSR